ncbi:MAG: HAMP domain-containing protein [Thermoanaerobaculia bacterium]|nr:HAMP domain-containing protein [Thermoanaerobaculia bacterium]
MKAVANLPIRTKLAGFVVVSTFLSLGTGFALVIYTTIQSFEDELIRSTRLVAHVVGDYSAISLAFNDTTDAKISLGKLQEVPNVTDAVIYDERGRVFVSYNRSGEIRAPSAVRDNGCDLERGAVHCFVPIVNDGKSYGTIYLRASSAELDARIRGYVLYVLLLMAALVAAGFVFAYLLQGFISEPILELARAARQISEHTDYSLRVVKPGEDEIGQLYDGFNAMLAQIQQRQQQLERSNRDLDQFAYVASHDLKAPLRAIATLSSWIEEDLAGKLDDEGKRQMELLRSRVRRMDGLIDGILHYSRIGRVETRGERVEVARLIAEVIEAIDRRRVSASRSRPRCRCSSPIVCGSSRSSPT